MKSVYAVLCVLGTLLPLAGFLPWPLAHGLDLPLLVRQAAAEPVARFAWLDVGVSALALAAFVLAEGRRLGMVRPWLALLGLGVGVSLALPLFLLLRQWHLETRGRRGAVPAA
ncbi:DUF2834 domain-containing protein [Xanthomonas massiliensis]|uniref:DUF2834 domain-containing protein n=1 Tax=Xanthomonas massiliensis TaxID=1720302 RepID=UPI000826DEBE|nr:DUF2834 domain-containing protein [Xanthomonas massiliensis]